MSNLNATQLLTIVIRTARASVAFQQRGGTCSSVRALQMIERYDSAQAALLASDEGTEAWGDYCAAIGAAPSHTAAALWA